MLDIKFIIENIEKISEGALQKRISFDKNQFLETYERRNKLLKENQELRSQRNAGSEAVRQIKDKSEREHLIQKMRETGTALEASDRELNEVEESFRTQMLLIPSIPSADTPVGQDESENVEWYQKGVPPTFDFQAKSHIEIGKTLGILNFEKGADVAGSRSFYLMGDGARLERAVHSLAMDLLQDRGFTPYSVPVLVRSATMEGTGYLPGGADQAYYIEKDDLWLVGTSEVPLASFFQGENLENAQLPKKVCAWSSCFRREAGAAGKDTKGLYRVHQFQKIEQVVVCEPDIEKSDKLHAELLKNSEDLLNLLELPYRVVKVCTGDLGQGQVKKHDIETWMPSRESYGETHSCSSFYDFQARRLRIKTKDSEGKNVFCYTLNNTAAATPRLLIPLLENHQTVDGRVRIPKALQKYMDGKEYIG